MDKNKNPQAIEDEEKNAVDEDVSQSPGKQTRSSLSLSLAPPNPSSSYDFTTPTNLNSFPFPTPQYPHAMEVEENKAMSQSPGKQTSSSLSLSLSLAPPANPNSPTFPTPQSPSIGRLPDPQLTLPDFNSGNLDRSNLSNVNQTDDVDFVQPRKKARPRWSGERNRKFDEALSYLGENAVPSKILKIMNEKGLTREAVACRLQKHKQLQRPQISNFSTSFDPLLPPLPPPPPPPPGYAYAGYPLLSISQNLVQRQQPTSDPWQTVGNIRALDSAISYIPPPPNVDEKSEEEGSETEEMPLFPAGKD